MKKILLILGIISLLFVSAFTPYTCTLQAKETNITWESTLYCNESSGKIDYVVFGEAPDANDGPPADNYDVAKPPAPMAPYIRAYFKDNLPSPYNALWKDYRFYPDSYKVWNLSIIWVPEDEESPTDIIITWNPTQVDTSEYTTINFCTNTGVVLKNMLIDSSYTFPCPANIPQNFKIICTSTSNPPETPSTPSGETIGYPGTSYTYSTSSTDPDGDDLYYQFDWGNNILSSWLGPYHSGEMIHTSYIWNTSGNYQVKTNAKDIHGTQSDWSMALTVTITGDTNDTNKPPIANASLNEQTGLIDTILVFNGSRSYDPDGYLTKWFWDFGDGINGSGETTTHTYQTIGTYTVTLTVTDDKNATGADTVMVQIITANQPPTKPIINGIRSGTKNKAYTYTVQSIDPENESLQYNIIWGDGTQNTSDFLPNGTIHSISHSWEHPGKYIITATATDNTTISEQATFTVFIDVHFVNTLGFLLDSNNDEIYDSFYTNVTGTTTKTQRLTNGSYLLDTNNDGKWNYLYDPISGSLTLSGDSKTATGNQWIFIFIIVLIIAMIICIVYFYKKKYF